MVSLKKINHCMLYLELSGGSFVVTFVSKNLTSEENCFHSYPPYFLCILFNCFSIEQLFFNLLNFFVIEQIEPIQLLVI